MRLYAAIAQSDQEGNPYGLQHAWAYLARYLLFFLLRYQIDQVTPECKKQFNTADMHRDIV